MKTRRLWCYLNIYNPVVAWEVAIGRISSIESAVDLTDESRRSFLSLWQFSRLKIASESQNWQPFSKEMRIEVIRHNEFNNHVSRLRGCYFFETREMAVNVVNSFNWGGSFREELLTEVEFFCDDHEVSTYDSAWIEQEMSDEDIRQYLNGETKYFSPATEFVCYGRGVILNEELIDKARKLVLEHFPKSEVILHSAIVIFDHIFKPSFQEENSETLWDAFHVAQVSPFFRAFDENSAKVTFVLSENAFKKYGVIHSKAEVKLPDLRPHEFLIPIESFNHANAQALKI
ncbi:TPA: hypothetical protein NKZ51_003924 [Vibrio parahaemolyticus]|uniref:hypothetical protein n=1 Tax=Vibrio parahaemolyticus TaxID=670 RepID=UPI00111E14BE|nr:hypothetical protein [Vibrio parahaemolyticus]QLE36337.1 hypothetical protein FDV79_11690 [Vibrio parahaemolyticus]HCH5588602.1 hypothetical protein [Vibrio parahaemolyticus]